MREQSDRKFNRLLLVSTQVFICIATTAGCTSQQGYASAQSWQRSECNKLLDQSDRDRCMAKASMSYDDYKRESGKAK
ncbi:MAG: hypothetical protein ABTQ26_19410 [Azonexus sp.]